MRQPVIDQRQDIRKSSEFATDVQLRYMTVESRYTKTQGKLSEINCNVLGQRKHTLREEYACTDLNAISINSGQLDRLFMVLVGCGRRIL